MSRKLGALFFLFGSVGLASADIRLQSIVRNASWHTLEFENGRVADLYVPACVSTSSPIVVSFHGLGFTKDNHPTYDQYYLRAEQECAVILYPQGKSKAVNVLGLSGYSWNAGGCCPDADMHETDDVGFIEEAIARIEKEFPVNGNLVFSSGISNGAMMALRYGCASSRVKGVISVAGPLVNGTGGDGGQVISCDRPVPTLYFHGTKDPICPYGGCNKTWSAFGHLCMELYKMGPGFPGGGIPSVPDFIAGRRALNGIDASVQGSTSFQNNSVTCQSWGSQANNVTLCTLEGMGHAWPNRDNLCYLPWTTCDNDIDATSEAWRFMNMYRKETITLV